MIPTTLVYGGNASLRECAIAEAIQSRKDASGKTAILIEGLANGTPVLHPDHRQLIARIASGCLCCDNNMIMRVHLNRLIQQKPHHLYISISSYVHIEQVKQFLATPSYKINLELADDLNLGATATEAS